MHISDTYGLHAPRTAAHTHAQQPTISHAHKWHVMCNATMLTSAPHKHIKCTVRHAERRLVAQQLHAHMALLACMPKTCHMSAMHI